MELNRFKQLLESTMGNSKPVINEEEDEVNHELNIKNRYHGKNDKLAIKLIDKL